MSEKLKLIRITLALFLAIFLIVSCGGGDGDQRQNGFGPPPPGGLEGGDSEEETPFTLGNFTLPGGTPFGDIRGIAASSRYVYVAETNAIHAFDLLGNYVNTASAANITGMVVIPPDPKPQDGDTTHYPYPEFPVIVYEPTENSFISIFAPNLDDLVTVEHQDYPDLVKRIDLPFIEDYVRYRVQPTSPVPDPPDPCPLLIVRTYDVDITREGTIVVLTDTDLPCTTPFPDFPMTMYFFDPHEGYLISPRRTGTVGVPDENGNPQPVQAPFRFAGTFGDQTGSLGQLAIANKYPPNRTDSQTLYLGGDVRAIPDIRLMLGISEWNIEVDFVGVNFLQVDTTFPPYIYEIGGIVNNRYGYNRVIGLPGGSLPGSFALTPPIGPGGDLEDPDLTAGGPSGMAINPRTDDLYVCDPGNRRVQVFDKNLNFVRQIGDGIRGTSGNHLVAPSEVHITLDGKIFIGDTLGDGSGIGWLRIFGETAPPEFGSVGGTVMNPTTVPPSPIVEATVTILNANGVVAIQNTNVNGEYRFDNLPLGTYFLTADKFGYSTDSTSVDLVADQHVIVNFNLYPGVPPTLGFYVGAVYDEVTNQAIAGVRVRIIGTSIQTYTDGSGTFFISDLPAGDYQVEFTHEDYITKTLDLHITAGQTTRHDAVKLIPLP